MTRPSSDPPPEAIAIALDQAAVDLRPPVRIERMDGGYSWRTYLLTGAEGASVVLRLAPRGGTLEPYDPQVEARAIAASRGAVPAPHILGVEPTGGALGNPYLIQSTAPGQVLRLSAVADEAERVRYRTRFARTLGCLHRDGDASAFGDASTVTEALYAELERVAQRYRRAATWPRVGFDIGMRWLLTHMPKVSDRPTFCHGDYRFGNLTWTAPGVLGAVLDWERAWCGDPMADVAFTRVYSGWCSVDGPAVADYEEAGIAVDTSRLHYAARFEQVRSYTASMLGEQAYRSGRSEDERLLTIGAAGEAGMATLVDWLNEGPLLPLPQNWRVEGDGASVPEYPSELLGESLIRLRQCRFEDPVGHSVSGAAATDEDIAQAWREAFVRLAPLAAHAPVKAAPALRALCLPAIRFSQPNG
ncbi:MAG: phosphotransferase family protein [Nostocoides sp.]